MSRIAFPTLSYPSSRRSACPLASETHTASSFSAHGLGLLAVLMIGILLFGADVAQAQYFGRNKVQYDDFDFHSIETRHFEIYLYPEEEQAVHDAARMAERWYERHSRTFLREFYERKPIIFYANDADFHQTNVIGGRLGEGTGGVTESLKERVIMPLTGSYKETDHVLGHELVHSFQYDIGLSGADSSRFAFEFVPLWLIEGMAEYLSVGRDDPNTAMWMRDAALHENLPTIDELANPGQFFPYRFGQSYLAYVGGKYGDAAVANLFKLSGRVGLDSAFVYTIGIKPDSLSVEWKEAINDAYLPLMEGRTAASDAGRVVLSEEKGTGSMNVAPVVSPDGQYVAFLSERELFEINLFIADANTGKIVKSLKGPNSNAHFDAIRFIASAGAWSPDGRKFAFITFVEGNNEISVLNWNRGNIERRFAVDGVNAITNVAWSPDGEHLAFSGMNGGISDLYLLNIESGNVAQLTDDRYADLQPTFSPDGRFIAFTTDRGPDGTNFETLKYGQERIATIDIETLDIRVIRPLDGAQHNPQFSPDGRSLFFISNHDGFKDVYRVDLASEQVFRITRMQTGVSGITALSPAMSVAQQSGRMMFSVYHDGKYSVFSKDLDELEGTPLEPATERPIAGILPPARGLDEGLVGNYLNDPMTGLPPDQDYKKSEYSGRLKLDYVAPPSIGVSAGGLYGSGVVGGVGFYLSDMLGNHNLTIVAQANGTFKDIGAQVGYLNLANRFNYGGQVGHIPIQYTSAFYGPRVCDAQTCYDTIEQLRRRIYVDQILGVGAYPFSTTRRVELTSGFTRYGFDYEQDTFFFSPTGVRREREQRDDLEPDAVYFAQAGLAFVTDYSFFGYTSPVRGGRSRFEVAPHVGSESFVRLQADYRKYFFMRPITLAFRGLHVGNYGAGDNSNQIFTTEYLGYANSIGFVRGYSFTSFDNAGDCTPFHGESLCAEQERLLGTRLGVASLELRIPLLGGESFGLLNFPYLPTELTLFADGGVAWTADDLPVWKFETDPSGDRIPVFSTGVSTRFNLFGYTIVEIFYAKPYQRPGKGSHFGFQLVPGW